MYTLVGKYSQCKYFRIIYLFVGAVIEGEEQNVVKKKGGRETEPPAEVVRGLAAAAASAFKCLPIESSHAEETAVGLSVSASNNVSGAISKNTSVSPNRMLCLLFYCSNTQYGISV